MLTFCQKSVIISVVRRCGGIGRHKGLKIPRGKTRTGSSPVSGTKKSSYIAFLRPKGLFFCDEKGRPFRNSLPFYHLFFFLFYLENKPHYPRYDLWTLHNYNFHKYYLPKCYSLYYSKIKNRLLNMTAQQANIRF